MKLSRIALATVLAAAPFAVANAGVTVTPLLLGYTWHDTALNNNKLTDAPELKDDIFVGAALGVELTPWLGFEAEYSQVKGDIKGLADGDQYKQQTIAGNFYATSDLITKNYDSKIKPYVLLGAGHVKNKYDGSGTNPFNYDHGTIGNAGVGAFWRLNDALSLRTEARGTYDFDAKYWNYTALAGLNVVLGGHLKPVQEVVEVAVVEPVPVPPPVQQPEQLTEDLNMELRVFFDSNKSNIKPQYKPEIAKVADMLGQFPNATARIDGYTDNTGTLKLNERLSLARANAVKAALVNEFNVNPSRLTAQGFAWFNPIASNATPEGRALNRRVFATITGSRTVTAQPDQQQQAAQ